MKIRPYHLWIPALTALSILTDTLEGAQVTPSADTAEQAWADIMALNHPSSSRSPSTRVKTLQEASVDRQQSALLSRQVSQAAKNFYESYPADQHAGQAKKLEATAGLQGVTDNDNGYEGTAISTAQRYRNDKGNSDSDRFDVAVGVERLQLSRRLKSPLYSLQPTDELEKVADTLHREFGELPKVYQFYASIARTADMVSAVRIANVMVASSAPSETRTEARTIIERAKLVGKRLPYVLNSVDGQFIDVAQPQDKPTVVFVWSASLNPSALLALKQFKDLSFKDCRWVYVSLGTTAEQLRATMDMAPFPGIHCYYPPQSGAPFVEGLNNRHFPYVYVIDRDGRLSGFGPVKEFPKLLAAAQR